MRRQSDAARPVTAIVLTVGKRSFGYQGEDQVIFEGELADGSSGLLAAYLGLASIVCPTSESGLGPTGGILAALWAIAFVASVGLVRGRSVAVGVDSPDSNEPDGRGQRQNNQRPNWSIECEIAPQRDC